jgi:endonuclease-3 related protein
LRTMELTAVEPQMEAAETLRQYYTALRERLGQQGWWPARTRLEVILGAILTQNTAWSNAALAVRRLRKAGLLNLAKLQRASRSELEHCIRPAGFYRQKALTIRNFLRWLERVCGGSLATLFALPAQEARRELLTVKGLGPETVDAILLYAGRHPYFVVDAYTRRILARHRLVSARANYSAVQQFLQQHLPPDQALFNQYHALLVGVGKRFCRRLKPNCEACPLKGFLPDQSIVGAGLYSLAVSVAHSGVP